MLLAACGSSETKIPEGVIEKDRLVKVLKEIHIEEARLNSAMLQGENVSTDTISFTEVFKANNITKLQFDCSMSFYTSHPEMLDLIYDEVISELNKMKGLEEVKK
jgi:hypothetical protein